MPRFLVPIDFSPISINAALYAVQMAEQMPRKEVVLFNCTEEIHAGIDGTPIEFNSDALISSNVAALENLQVSLFEMGISPMEVVAEIGELPEKIKPAIKKYNIDMVVMGIKGNGSPDNYYFGKNAVEISRENTCPVMVVPPQAMFKGSGRIAVAVNYENVTESVSVAPLKKWLDNFEPVVHFVYVAGRGKASLTEEQERERKKLEILFADYKTVFNVVEAKNFSDGMNEYIDRNQIDHVVVFPKKSSGLNNFFSTDQTRRLTYYSRVPVISVHE